MDNKEKKETKKDEIIKEENVSSKKKGKGKWFVIIAIILVVIVAVIAIYNRNNYYYFDDDDDDLSSYGRNEISADLFNFECSLSNEAGTEKIEDHNVYGVGDHLLCNIKMSYKYDKQIRSVALDFVSHNVELVEVYSISDDWHIKVKDTSLYKEGTYVYLTSMGRSDNAKITDVKFHLHIKGNENVDDSFGVGFGQVTISLVNENKDDHFDEKIIGFPIGESRYYKKGDSIIFEKVQEDGSFKEVNSYKCRFSDWCTTSNAKEGFGYQNDNKNTVMITDKENDKYIAIIFNVDKGIVGTYSDTESWLYSNKYEYQSGTYIYIKAKDSENFGIIDKEGNIIHEFNLGATNAFYKSQLLSSAYSIENDMIIDQKDNKYGVSKISSNDKIIDYKFDSIRFIVNGKSTEIKEGTAIHYIYEKTVDNKYFKAKLNGKWYLYSFDTKEKVTSEGYDNLFVANDKILVVEKDKYLYITDYQGNKLLDDKIENLSKEYLEYVCCAANPGIEVGTKDNIITITTYKDNNWEDYNQYEYNISDNTLTKKK